MRKRKRRLTAAFSWFDLGLRRQKTYCSVASATRGSP
ncbi:Uncharacterised protein [Bordetella pertussis]|nr:Uncharacterised protein [Bordetella pertussis]CFP63439.1 Uncharacterised protein [Bordetella pertussis]